MELQGIKINFLGDSITEGAGVSAPEHRYPDLIAAETGAICRNYGISGSRIARQYRPSADGRMDRDFCSRVAEMEPDATWWWSLAAPMTSATGTRPSANSRTGRRTPSAAPSTCCTAPCWSGIPRRIF